MTAPAHYYEIAKAGTLALYERVSYNGSPSGSRQWAVEWPDGTFTRHADRPSISGLVSRGYDVPSATPKRWTKT
jgi:hypothetical protein